MAQNPPIYLLKRVLRWSSSDHGDMIQLEVTVEDGSLVILRCAYQDVSKLVQAIVQGAAIAEQIQRKMPGQVLEVVTPWMATGVRSGSSGDNKFAALNFQTTEGVPVQVTMSVDLARETIERLSDELDRMGITPPHKAS